jgi:hypothetical protein
MELSNDCILLILEKVSKDIKFIRLVSMALNYWSRLKIKTKSDAIFYSSVSRFLLGIELNRCSEEYICCVSAREGYLDTLKYAHQKGCYWDCLTCYYAATEGQLECLKYAHDNGCPWDNGWTFLDSALEGNLKILKYLHENGCPWNERACANAAQEGHLECLKYLHENGCPWDGDTIDYAEARGHFEIVSYSRENGCPEHIDYI